MSEPHRGVLQDKVAVVTGASGGIGRGIARAYGAEGAWVVIASRSREAGERVAHDIEKDFAAAGARAVFIRTDVGEEASVRSMVEEVRSAFGPIAILVHNATPSGGMARLERMETAAMEEHARVNTTGAFWAMQAVFPDMRSAGWGRIITLCSLNGINAHRYTAMYNASKEALRSLTRTAAAEWGPYGITCNVLCPAAVTPPWEVFVKLDPEGAGRLVDSIPLRRMGDAERDIGPPAVFLASEGSRYVTGNTIHADGGGHIAGVPWSFELPE